MEASTEINCQKTSTNSGGTLLSATVWQQTRATESTRRLSEMHKKGPKSQKTSTGSWRSLNSESCLATSCGDGGVSRFVKTPTSTSTTQNTARLSTKNTCRSRKVAGGKLLLKIDRFFHASNNFFSFIIFLRFFLKKVFEIEILNYQLKFNFNN